MENRRLTRSEQHDGHLPARARPSRPGFEQRLHNTQMLVSRLERLSADSYWAHQASGLRGSLLRCLEQMESSQLDGGPTLAAAPESRLDGLLDQGFEILNRAAQEVASRPVLSNEKN